MPYTSDLFYVFVIWKLKSTFSCMSSYITIKAAIFSLSLRCLSRPVFQLVSSALFPSHVCSTDHHRCFMLQNYAGRNTIPLGKKECMSVTPRSGHALDPLWKYYIWPTSLNVIHPKFWEKIVLQGILSYLHMQQLFKITKSG